MLESHIRRLAARCAPRRSRTRPDAEAGQASAFCTQLRSQRGEDKALHQLRAARANYEYSI